MDNKLITVSSTPHVRSKDSIDGIMKDVIIALVPASIMGVYYFGINALIHIIICIASCLLAEYLFQTILKKEHTIKDCSAVVTGLLLALNLPVEAPFWLPVVGGFFAIIVVKMLFGGLGQNFMNPALGARAFLVASYPVLMTTWTNPGKFGVDTISTATSGVDAVSSATPLALLKTGDLVPQSQDYINALIGNIGGCIGETCAIALILGGLYLMYKGVISFRIPATFIATVFILSFLVGRNGLYEILLGGVMLGAFFMATDYSSSPVTPTGQIIMGIGCGAITVIIRKFGGYPEGVSYSILLMNLCVPLIDRYTQPKVFGEVKKA